MTQTNPQDPAFAFQSARLARSGDDLVITFVMEGDVGEFAAASPADWRYGWFANVRRPHPSRHKMVGYQIEAALARGQWLGRFERLNFGDEPGHQDDVRAIDPPQVNGNALTLVVPQGWFEDLDEQTEWWATSHAAPPHDGGVGQLQDSTPKTSFL